MGATLQCLVQGLALPWCQRPADVHTGRSAQDWVLLLPGENEIGSLGAVPGYCPGPVSALAVPGSWPEPSSAPAVPSCPWLLARTRLSPGCPWLLEVFGEWNRALMSAVQVRTDEKTIWIPSPHESLYAYLLWFNELTALIFGTDLHHQVSTD